MKKKFFATMLTVFALACLVVPQLETHALSLKEDVDSAIAQQGFYFQDYGNTGRINIDRYDSEWGDEQQMVYLTDATTKERITEVRIGEEYILHFLVINNGVPGEALENVRVMIGQGDNYDSVNLNALVFFGDREDDTHGCVEFYSQYPVVDRRDDAVGDGWVRLKPVGKAKLYNHGGHLNGAQVNHKNLFLSGRSSGILIGYDDQDGYLPYGKEYACEIRVRVRLESDRSWYWSDPIFEGRYTGRIIENGKLADAILT